MDQFKKHDKVIYCDKDGVDHQAEYLWAGKRPDTHAILLTSGTHSHRTVAGCKLRLAEPTKVTYGTT